MVHFMITWASFIMTLCIVSLINYHRISNKHYWLVLSITMANTKVLTRHKYYHCVFTNSPYSFLLYTWTNYYPEFLGFLPFVYLLERPKRKCMTRNWSLNTKASLKNQYVLHTGQTWQTYLNYNLMFYIFSLCLARRCSPFKVEVVVQN